MTFEEEDEDVWVAEDAALPGGRPAVRVSVIRSDGQGAPTPVEVAAIELVLSNIDAVIAADAVLLLRNYSRDHFQSLGVPEDRLVEETPEAVAAAVTLEEVAFFDLAAGEYETSYALPWDERHVASVEHEQGEPTSCAFNG
ncbi:hypothetical protein [Alienimonas sp. DA493]|uniref:hypothetical protein n=1 Tax=Alienimonas sp. DA493 TaxID=3373605 RepID=UPI0037553448